MLTNDWLNLSTVFVTSNSTVELSPVLATAWKASHLLGHQFYLLVCQCSYRAVSPLSRGHAGGNTDVIALEFVFNLKPEGSITGTICDTLFVSTHHNLSHHGDRQCDGKMT